MVHLVDGLKLLLDRLGRLRGELAGRDDSAEKGYRGFDIGMKGVGSLLKFRQMRRGAG